MPYFQTYFFIYSFSKYNLHRTKVKSTKKTPTNSMKTIQLEDLFGSASFANKYTYPNTVPQAKVSTLKSFADLDGGTNADFKVAAYSSASLSNSKRRYQETNPMYVQ